MSHTVAKLLPALLLLTTAAPALAEPVGEIEELRHRLEKLEAREKDAEGFAISLGRKKLRFWGALEVEAGYLDQKDQAAASDVNVASALLGLDVTCSDRLTGRIALLHEDGEEPEVALDEAHLTVSRPKIMGGEAKITAGRNHLPFGAFASIMVSDPLTLELGETNRNLVLTGWENGKVAVQAGFFNGERDTTGHDVIDNGVAALSFTPTEQISFGVSYLCDLAESKADLLAGTDPAIYEKNVGAASAHLTLKLAPVTVTVEYLGALKEFSKEVITDPGKTSNLTGLKPRTWFTEATFAPSEDWAVSGRYEKAKDYQNDVARYGATVSYGLDVNTTLSLEYLYSDFARETEDTAQQVTVQLALEF